MRSDLKNDIKRAFMAPAPCRKNEFINKYRSSNVGVLEILRTQASYIRISSWILLVMMLPVVVLGIRQSPENAIRLAGAISPFLAALGIMETWRSYTYHMAELEQATRFSLRTVIYARMLLMGCAGMLMMLLSAVVLSFHFQSSLLLMAARVMIPYLITMTIGLHIERTTYGRNNSYCSVTAAAVIAVFVLWSDAAPVSILTALSAEWIVTIAAGLIILTVLEAIKTLRFTEAYA